MNRFNFVLENLDEQDVSVMNDLAQLFILINTIGSNVDYLIKNGGITEIEVDLPFDAPFPKFTAVRTQVVDNSEIESSPELRTFPYVTVGSVVGIVADDNAPRYDLTRYYLYRVFSASMGASLYVYVGIANSALTESYAPFGVREGTYPPNVLGMAITSENALQNMLNACSCPPRNPSTGLSSRDLRATSL